jgi:MoCo/4Fe-4S cofactor protein with predicted Tat translocation signal
MNSHPHHIQGAERNRLTARGQDYWRSLEELSGSDEFAQYLHREFPDRASEWLAEFSRRDFLSLMGASLALAGLSACTRQPVERIIPYVKQPEELVLGMPQFYATAMELGGFATGLLVESHEGHPTKIEGNPEHPMSLGASRAFHQAALLDLYDPDRSQAVLDGGVNSSWEAFLASLNSVLISQQAKGGAGMRLLTETISSPSLTAQLNLWRERYPRARWHQYEPFNRDAAHAGAELAFGEVVDAQYDFRRARIILALESDFLTSHPACLRYARDFAELRRVTQEQTTMSRFYAVESVPTLTGSMADHRAPLRAGDIELLARLLAVRLGASAEPAPSLPRGLTNAWITALIADLEQNRGASIVIAGDHQPPIVHALAHRINHALGNIGSTIRYTSSALSSTAPQGESLRQLASDLDAGDVDLLVVLGGNPVFNAPVDLQFARCLAKAKLRVHLSLDVNETTAQCQWHIPQAHFLESWSDTRAYDGTISIVQPLILPLYGGKSPSEIVEAMLTQTSRSDYQIVRDYWAEQRFWGDFEVGWKRSVHDGLVVGTALPDRSVRLRELALPPSPAQVTEQLELAFRPDPTVGDGRFVNNGWLQELPKPFSKLTWDNAAFISPALAQRRQLTNGDWVDVEFQQRQLRIPVFIMPGQADDTVLLTCGYGRTQVGRVGQRSGFNPYAIRFAAAPWTGRGAELHKAGGHYEFAATQTHHAIDSEARQILREVTLAQFLANADVVRQTTELPAKTDTLFNPAEHAYEGQRWGMAIDLSTCMGCNACIVACQSENNIPVVGKAQVARHREMHWLRIDTYYLGAEDNPSVCHQPVPCMHCENAPCELVCPVGATVHDHEGLNVQVYNRCIGTRYCSNNCPYKVRRFNFFHYADEQSPSLKPMRNPNVTVRWRGVMEKCTYCVQRVSAARIRAKETGRPIRDGEIATACQQSCPTDAIVFGDLSDPNSRVSKVKLSPLDFSMLGGLNTRPRTTYRARVHNPHPSLPVPINSHAT